MSNPGESGANSNDGTAALTNQRRRAPQHDIPLSNILKIMRSILPGNARITDEAKETVQKCVSEFIRFVTAKANEHSREEQRKTVTADDLLWAMRVLGLENYAETLTAFMAGYREQEYGRASTRHELHGHPLPTILHAPVNSYAVQGFPVPEFVPVQMNHVNGSSSSSSSYGGGYTNHGVHPSYRSNFE